MHIFEMLSQNFRNRDAELISIFENGKTFIADIEDTDNGFNSDITIRNICVDEVSDSNKREHKTFASNAFKADRTAQIILKVSDSETR